MNIVEKFCADIAPGPRAHGAALRMAKVYPKKVARFVSMYILWKKSLKGSESC